MNNWLRLLCCVGPLSSLLPACYSIQGEHWSCGQKIDEEFRYNEPRGLNKPLDRSQVRWPVPFEAQKRYGESPVWLALYDIRNTNEPLVFNVSLDKIALNNRDMFYFREKYCVSESYLGAVWMAKLNYDTPTEVTFTPSSMKGYLKVFVGDDLIHNSDNQEPFEHEFSAGEHRLRVDFVTTDRFSRNLSLQLNPSPFLRS